VLILAEGREGAAITLLQLSNQLQGNGFIYCKGSEAAAFDYINASCEAGVDHRR
jgi:hypothetical protein